MKIKMILGLLSLALAFDVSAAQGEIVYVEKLICFTDATPIHADKYKPIYLRFREGNTMELWHHKTRLNSADFAEEATFLALLSPENDDPNRYNGPTISVIGLVSGIVEITQNPTTKLWKWVNRDYKCERELAN